MSKRSVVARLAEEKGLVIVSPEALTVRRQRCGKGFAFVTETGAFLRDPPEIKRLKALAVPPAYVNVRFAADAIAHLQAVGEDAAGRLQYRYHAKWAEVREALKTIMRTKHFETGMPFELPANMPPAEREKRSTGMLSMLAERFRESADAVVEGVYDGLTGRSGAYRPGWRPGLGALRLLVGLAWRLKK